MQKKQRIPVLYTAICFLVAGIISAAVEPAFIQTGRYKFRPPQKIMDAAGIKPGMVVGEVGAGKGFFTFSLAERVGENGIVYANDIAPEMLDRISYRCQMQGVKNIKTVLGKVEDPLFPIKNLDMIETFLLRDNIYIFRIDKEKESNVWQKWFWTGDKFNSNRAFVIRLPGALLVDSLLINFSYVRPVRSL